MNVYLIFVDDNEGGFVIPIAILNDKQASLLGSSFISISKIETYDGESVYERKHVASLEKKTVH